MLGTVLFFIIEFEMLDSYVVGTVFNLQFMEASSRIRKEKLLPSIIVSCGWPCMKASLQNPDPRPFLPVFWMNDMMRLKLRHRCQDPCTWESDCAVSRHSETKVWVLSLGHHAFLTRACSSLCRSYSCFSSSLWTSRPIGTSVVQSCWYETCFCLLVPFCSSKLLKSGFLLLVSEAFYSLHPRLFPLN